MVRIRQFLRRLGRQLFAVAATWVSLLAINHPVEAVEAVLIMEEPLGFVDEPLAVTLRLSNPPRRVGRPRLPDVRGLVVEGPFTPSQQQTINRSGGRSEMQVHVDYPFRITPKETGTYTIGPATVALSDQSTAQSGTIELQVLRRSRQANVRFGVSLHPKKATVGTPIRVVYTASFARNLEQLEGLDLPILNISQAKVVPIVIDKKRSPQQVRLDRSTTIYSEDGFQVVGDEGLYTLSFGFELTPMSTGNLTLPAATVQMSLRTGRMVRRRIGFSTGMVPETKTYTARSQAITIKVAELPTRNRPPSFDGAIGRFRFEVTAKPTEVPVFAPIELTMTIRGYGNIEKAPPPPFSRLPELQRDFDTSTDVDGGQMNERKTEKTFRQVIRPRNARVTAIPPIPFAFYNPERGDYEIAYSKAIPITVQDMKTVGGADAIPSKRAQTDDPSSAASRAPASLIEQAGVGANFRAIGPSRHVLDPRAEVLSAPFLATLCLPPAAFLLLLASRRRGRRDPVLVRRQKALARAHGRLRGDALSTEEVSGAFQDYFRERLALGDGELTPPELSNNLGDRTVEPALGAKVSSLLERLLAGRFGGHGESATTLAAEAVALLSEVDRCVRD